MNKTENIKEYKRKYYQKNKERLSKINKEWAKDNIEKCKEYQKKYRQKSTSKEFARKRNRKWTKMNPDKVGQRREMNKEKQRIYVKKSNQKYPEHIKARQIAGYKIKIIKNQLCQEKLCKNMATERHHKDYNKPLEVSFLCNGCHSIKHRKVEMPLGV